jgi:hypothetical protein
MSRETTLDRIIVMAIALLIAAFALSAVSSAVLSVAQADDLVGKRADDSDELATVDDDDDDDDRDAKAGTRTGTTQGTGPSNTNTRDTNTGTFTPNTGTNTGNGGGANGNTGHT